MGLKAEPILETFGAVLSGVDISRPLASEDRDAIVEAIEKYGVVIFRDTGLDDASHIAFTRAIGNIYVQPPVRQKVGRPLPPELFEAGNLGADGEIDRNYLNQMGRRGNELWHTDHSFIPERSAYSLLLAHEIPEGQGDTSYADMRGAYEALPEETKARLEGLVGEHAFWHSRLLSGYPVTEEETKDRQPIAKHPIVQLHEGSGRKTLYIASHLREIDGMPTAEARQLIKELTEFATQPQFTFSHKWRVGDLVIWDNRCTMHRANPFDDEEKRRDLRRTNTLDVARLPVAA